MSSVKSREGVNQRETPVGVLGDVCNLKVSGYECVNHYEGGYGETEEGCLNSVLGTFDHLSPLSPQPKNNRQPRIRC